MFLLLALLAPAVPGALNQDVTQATIATTICKSGWTATVRPSKYYTGALKYRLVRKVHGRVGDYELDHAIPLELGGAASDPRNLWLEPHAGKWGSRRKDRLENKLRALVCKGIITLDEGRHEIWPDWIKFYRLRIGK